MVKYDLHYSGKIARGIEGRLPRKGDRYDVSDEDGTKRFEVYEVRHILTIERRLTRERLKHSVRHEVRLTSLDMLQGTERIGE